jgi:hypothetical protein
MVPYVLLINGEHGEEHVKEIPCRVSGGREENVKIGYFSSKLRILE